MVKIINPQPLALLGSHGHVVWAALEKMGQKELNAAQLVDGSRHRLSLRIDGNVDDLPFSQTVESMLSIGYGQEKASCATPQLPELVAFILSKLNHSTRHRLLNDIPEDFQENDQRLPASDPELLNDVKQMLKQLRQAKTIQARGAIRCEYAL